MGSSAAPVTALTNTLPAGKDCKEFMVGVTGIHADIKGGVLRVTKVTPKTPADGKLQVGDVLLAVDGARLDIQDQRHPLGFAINAAEGRDGKMKFSIRRGEAKQTVTIQLQAVGSYSATFPVNCRKSRRIVNETAAFILKQGGPGGGINTAAARRTLRSASTGMPAEVEASTPRTWVTKWWARSSAERSFRS